jgi:F-type H+-transporting ATPase subunit delta
MSAFAARYARALADVVSEAKLDPSRVDADLRDFSATFDGSRELREVLLDPTLAVHKRVSILDAVSRRGGWDPKVRNFLAVLIQHERLSSFSEILEQYRLEVNRRQDIAEAEVTTARKLTPEERAEIEKNLAGLTTGQLRTAYREDASLLGGAIVRIGSTVYDGSINGRLQRLRERLVAS